MITKMTEEETSEEIEEEVADTEETEEEDLIIRIMTAKIEGHSR